MTKSKTNSREQKAEQKVFSVKCRLIVFATVFIAATSPKNAKLKMRMPQTQWGGRIDYEEHTARTDDVESVTEVQS